MLGRVSSLSRLGFVKAGFSARVTIGCVVTTTLSFSTERSESLEGNEEYQRFIDELLRTNISDYVSIPTIASMGDTSSGKTSVLSSLTNIEPPSSDQLTTRCPIMLQMRQAESQSAKVSVSWKDSNAASELAKFEPMSANESNWNDLSSMIEQAQQHIIDATGKEVARDVVSVELQGPDCVNLTVIDLPGIIRTTGKGESSSLSEDTQSLINEYMVNPRCVILAVHPSNVDFHNSSIMADAKRVDPETRRTLPVLTKPDLIDSGGEQSVEELLLGKKIDGFQQGFHMVRSRGQAALDRNETIEQGLRDEKAFFATTAPWCNIENKMLFGVPNLRRKLGELQIEMARETFPDIVKEMSEQKDSAESELATYGNVLGSSSERRIFFSEVQDRTVKVLHALLSGSNTRDIGFDTHLPSARFHDECLCLRETLRKGRLYNAGQTAENSKVIISYMGEEFRGTVMRIDNDKDKYYFDIEKSDKPSDRESDFVMRNAGTDAFKHLVGTVFEHGGYNGYLALVQTEDGQFDLLKGLSKSDVTMVPDTERLRSLIKQNRSYKVPVFANNEIFESLVAKYLDEDWLQPCLALVTKVSDILKSAVTEVIANDLQIASFPRMRRLLVARIEHEIDVFVEEATVEVAHFVRREKTPYTQNHYLNETLSSRRVQRFLDVAKKALEDSTRDDRSYDKKKN